VPRLAWPGLAWPRLPACQAGSPVGSSPSPRQAHASPLRLPSQQAALLGGGPGQWRARRWSTARGAPARAHAGGEPWAASAGADAGSPHPHTQAVRRHEGVLRVRYGLGSGDGQGRPACPPPPPPSTCQGGGGGGGGQRAGGRAVRARGRPVREGEPTACHAALTPGATRASCSQYFELTQRMEGLAQQMQQQGGADGGEQGSQPGRGWAAAPAGGQTLSSSAAANEVQLGSSVEDGRESPPRRLRRGRGRLFPTTTSSGGGGGSAGR